MARTEVWLSHLNAAVSLAADLEISVTRAFGTIVEACQSGVRSRCRNSEGEASPISDGEWSDAEVTGYEVRFPDGTVTDYDHIEINQQDLSDWVDRTRAIRDSLTESLKQAPKNLIRKEIRAAYDEAFATGTKPPNIKELPRLVLPRLKAQGFKSTATHIIELGGASEFASRRLKPGDKRRAPTSKR